jgi:hypothetical protein
VTWSGQDNTGGSGVATYDVQYRENGGAWQHWYEDTTLTSAWGTGLVDGTRYELRARATDYAGNVQTYSQTPQTYTIVELSGPLSKVKVFDPSVISDTQFLVEWSSQTSPATSVDYYDVRYQFRDGPWTSWLAQTKLTNQVFTQVNATDGAYRFQVRARDSVGRLEDWSTLSQATIYVDRNPPFLAPAAYLPIIRVHGSP